MITVKHLTFEEFISEGTRLFGPDDKAWKFACPNCDHVQCGHDFLEAGQPYKGAVSFRCIECGFEFPCGGFRKDTPINMAHTKEVEGQYYNNYFAVFEFSAPTQLQLL